MIYGDLKCCGRNSSLIDKRFIHVAFNNNEYRSERRVEGLFDEKTRLIEDKLDE